MSKFQIVDYYDVWYNEEEEYYVNDVARTGLTIDITDDDSDMDILNKLIDVAYFENGVIDEIESIYIDYLDDTMIEISHIQYDGTLYPLCRLEKVF